MSYNQITMVQRYQIEALIKEELSKSYIATNLGVHRFFTRTTKCVSSLKYSHASPTSQALSLPKASHWLLFFIQACNLFGGDGLPSLKGCQKYNNETIRKL